MAAPYDVFQGSTNEIKLVLASSSKKQGREIDNFHINTRGYNESMTKSLRDVESLFQQQMFTSNFKQIKKYLKVRQTVFYVPESDIAMMDQAT